MSDLDYACDLGKEYAFEKSTQFDKDNFRSIWTSLIETDTGKMFLSAAGGIGVTFYRNMLTGEPECHVAFWFVTPALRKQGYGMQLLKAAEDEARARGCKAFFYSHPGRWDAGLVSRGFEPLEVGYKKEL